MSFIEQKMTGIESKVMEVTPEMAKKWLDNNIDNQRKLKPRIIEKYANDMANGKWELTHQGIAFNDGIKLIDGQHRLAACIQVDVPFMTMVFTGISENSKYGIDRPTCRTFADSLYMNGFRKNNNNNATIIRYLYVYKKLDYLKLGFKHNINKLNIHDLDDFANKEIDIKTIYDAYLYIQSIYRYTKIISPSISSFCYLIFKEITENQAKDFMEKLFLGTDIGLESPIMKLRNKLFQLKESKVFITNDQKILLLFSVWNKYRKKEDLYNINFNRLKMEKPI